MDQSWYHPLIVTCYLHLQVKSVSKWFATVTFASEIVAIQSYFLTYLKSMKACCPFPLQKKTTSISIVQRRTHLSGQNSKSRHRSSLLNQKPITTRAEMWPSRQLKPDWVWWLRRRLLSHSGLHWGGAALRRETGRWGNFAPPVHLSCCWPSFKQLPKTFETAAKSCQKVVRALLIFWQSYPFNVDDVDCA